MSKVFLVTSAHPQFDTRIFHKEAVALVRAGYDVSLIAPRADNETVAGVKIRGFYAGRGRAGRFGAFWRPFRAAYAKDVDVYHVHDPELIFTAIALKVLTGAKIIYDVHEDVPKDIMSKAWIPRPLRRPAAFFAKTVGVLSGSAFDSIVAATPAIARSFPENKTLIVQNMPILEEFEESRGRDYNKRPPNLSYVGSITEIRGAFEMITAIRSLPTDLGASLSIAGAFSPPELESELRSAAVGVAVAFHGQIDRPEVVRILSNSRAGLVLFHPKQNHVESQPNKLFEYMAAGIPIIASDFPHWREIISNVDCGLLVDPLDPKAIAEAIQYILEHPTEAEAMGKRGRQAILTRYNWASESRGLLSLYKELTE